MLRLLTFSSLYPNAAQPAHGIFVEQRLRQMIATGRVTSSVIAPVWWFPFRAACFGRYATYAAVPRQETRHGIEISHPRFPLIPKVGMTLAPAFMKRWTARTLVETWQRTRAQLLDAHYLYPDGVAAAQVARSQGWPYVLTARGSDVNQVGEYAGPRRSMLDAIAGSLLTITVSEALRSRLVEFGAAPEKLVVGRNGVDINVFRPGNRAELRERWSVDGFVILAVGKLDENKGQHLVIEALQSLPEATLLIAGEGPWQSHLSQLAASVNVAARVRMLGTVPHEKLPELYSLADVVTLPSAREGLPNVVLEALACGCPVIATRVGGVAEVLPVPECGQLLEERSSAALVTALWQIGRNPPDRARVRAHAETMAWEGLAAGLVDRLEAAASTAGVQLSHTSGGARTL